jgi:predicted nucleic acid-binding protein
VHERLRRLRVECGRGDVAETGGREAQGGLDLLDARVAYPDERFPPAYGSLLAWQERHRGRISTMDLLIATSAVVAGASLVTGNLKAFSRVPGLEVVSY